LERFGSGHTRRSAQFGFTLIELISVIVILGVLSAVALPKFVSLRRDAIISTMHGINGALDSAATLAFAKSLINGVQDQASANVVINGTNVAMVYGYPAGTAAGIVSLMVAPPGDWKQRASTYTGAWVYWHGVIAEDAGVANCYIRYRQSEGPNLRPVINFVSTGC